MDLRKLRDRAADAFAKGRFSKAAELYAEYCEKDPRDIQAKLRMGDAWAKAGERPKAIEAYKAAAEAFAREGFLPRAIAASKLILELDPGHQGIQQMLADLYARRRSDPPRRQTATGVPAAAPVRSRHAPIELSDEPDVQGEPSGSTGLASEPAVPAMDPGVGAVVPQGAVELPPELEIFHREAPEAGAGGEGEAGAGGDAPMASAGEPPGLKRRAVAASGVDEAAPSAPPSPSRVFVPGRSYSPSTWQQPATPPANEVRGDLARAFSRFDELSLEDAPDSAPDAAPEAEAPARLPTFTELELEGDSLLHAVEVAAMAGRSQRGEALSAPGEEEEEVFSLTAEVAAQQAPSPDVLPKIPLFSDLPPDAFIELFERCPLRRYGEGERIIAQGSVGDAFYVVCEGSVRVLRRDGDSERVLATLKEGAFFGEMALLSGSPRSASVDSASGDTQVLEISAPVLAQLSVRFPQVASALRKFCRSRMLSNVMNTSALFRPFPKSDRRQLISRFRAREVNKGQRIIRAGGETDGLYVVLSGEVEVSRDGKVLARLQEGEIFGEMSLLKKTAASADVTATRRTSLLRLPRPDFDALVLGHPQILAMISELTEDRERHTDAVLSGSAVVGEEGLLLV